MQLKFHEYFEKDFDVENKEKKKKKVDRKNNKKRKSLICETGTRGPPEAQDEVKCAGCWVVKLSIHHDKHGPVIRSRPLVEGEKEK